ncbi:MAG: DUF5937 family protein, partial [Micromonosporaceae bacterium]
MIQVRMKVTDLSRTRFAYSPLIEVAESIYKLSSGNIHPLYQSWYEEVRPRLHRTDLDLLCAVTPANGRIADFYLHWATSPTTTIDQQLDQVAALPAEFVRQKIERVWNGGRVPARAAELFSSDGPRRLADALGQYWSIAIEPHWPAIRRVLDDDVAHRAGGLATNGLDGLLGGLHREVRVREETMQIGDGGLQQQDTLSGAGMYLVPSVFLWPEVIFAVEDDGPARLMYPARGIGAFQETAGDVDGEALAALIGRSRAEILLALATPHTTTELA